MKISVVMASRNPDVKKLADAIKSVLNQTYKDFELIIVDDGSDESISPIVSTITGDERVRVFRIEPSGLGAALNYGIKQSQAKYIARLDDDDLMAKDRLQKQYLQPIITQYFIDNKSEIWLLFLIAHSKR